MMFLLSHIVNINANHVYYFSMVVDLEIILTQYITKNALSMFTTTAHTAQTAGNKIHVENSSYSPVMEFYVYLHRRISFHYRSSIECA